MDGSTLGKRQEGHSVAPPVRPFYLPGSYLVLELANGCNLKCSHCAQSDETHAHYVKTGYFPREGVERLLRDLERHGIRFDVLILFWLGEPLLHPEFTDIYMRVLDFCGPGRVFGQIELHTNATMLSRRMAARVLNRHPAPQRWHLTIDAASAQTYLDIKGLDLLPRVEENVARLIHYKGKGAFPYPQVVLQYIVSDRNEAEVTPFIERWSPVFAQARLSLKQTAFHVPHDHQHNYLFFKSLDCPTPEEQTRQNGVYQQVVRRLGLAPPHEASAADKIEATEDRLAEKLETPCSGFWKSPVIGWDGLLTTCTRDSLGENAVGNVLETPFSELWFGEGRLRQWRQEVGAGSYHSLSLCQTCFIPRSVNYTGISAAEIAEAAAVSTPETGQEGGA